jgi:hypothetical protein
VIRFSRYRFNFSAVDLIRLPAFAGSAFRGMLGHGLKRTVCVTNLEDCNACALRSQCAYTQLFETRAATGQQGASLQPMVIALDSYQPNYEPEDSFALELALIGRANRHFPYLISSWQRAGQRGLGKRNSQFSLTSVEKWHCADHRWATLYPEPEEDQLHAMGAEVWQPDLRLNGQSIKIRLLTPYRSKRDGRLIAPDRFDPHNFTSSLISRVERLRAQHDPESPPLPVADWIAASKTLRMERPQLRWSDIQRHSSRQQTDMNLGGVVGSFLLQGEALEQLLPVLELGQWLHAGKNTLFGLGQYRLLTPEVIHD